MATNFEALPVMSIFDTFLNWKVFVQTLPLLLSGLTTTLTLGVTAIILGFIGLSQVKKTGERGRGLALWAIVLGFVSIIIGIIVSIIVVTAIAANPNISVS